MSTRKHIFRAKSVSDGEWVYGDLIHYNHPNREKVCIRSVEWPQIESDVEEETVGEFTGLLDKNGKEIYEGDILSVDGRQIGYIVGGVRGYCYDVVYTPPLSNGERDWSLYGVVVRDYPNKCDISGNIHDNKDLVNKE